MQNSLTRPVPMMQDVSPTVQNSNFSPKTFDAFNVRTVAPKDCLRNGSDKTDKAVVTDTVGLRFDRHSTPIGLKLVEL